ncbi:MAG TPA: cytochrome c biogenesis protein CcdA [Symbiobacteriaceae bacterium]|nr:cytochrome c biogenesis protein CcdA [Symbiobacteriaceae bacterium]
MDNPNLLLAFGAGVLAFLTPCCLPIYPSFLSYVTGVSVTDLNSSTAEIRARVLKHSLAFFVGFSAIYVAMGLTASALGAFFVDNKSWLPVVGGIWVAVMGLTMLGIIKIPFLMREYRMNFTSKPQGYVGSAIVGLTYAAGWTPCVGPILGAVVGMAAANPGYGGILLLAYSVGFAVPFIGLAYAIGSVRVLTKYTGVVERVGGVLMVVTGILLATGLMEAMSRWFIEVTGFQGFF